MKYIDFLALTMACVCVACTPDNENNNQPQEPSVTPRMMVLNTGNIYSGVDGELSMIYYNDTPGGLSDVSVTNNLFQSVNHRSLGKAPNQAILYGSRLYVAVDESNTIEVVDKDGTSVGSIQLAGNDQGWSSPRQLTGCDGKVYVTLKSGHVACLDTLTLEMDPMNLFLGEGSCPEGIAAVGQDLYVATSGDYTAGYRTTMARIDLTTHTVDTIPCGLNPTVVKTAADGGIYVLCMGDYYMTKAAVWRVDGTEPVEICNATMFDIPEGSNTLYAIDCPWDGPVVTYLRQDLTTDEQTVLPCRVTYPASIAVDARTGYIAITSYYMGGDYPSYNTPGYVALFDREGNGFGLALGIGIGPATVVFL